MKPRKETLIKRLWQLQEDLELIEGELDGWRLKLIENGSVEAIKARIKSIKKEINLTK